MGDQSQSGSVRGDQRTLICNHVATRGNQRRSDVHSDAIERKSEAFKRPSEAIRCNQEAIRGHQRRSEKLTCQSGSASSPPSSSSPASTCGKRRGRHGEHLHAEARPSRGSAAPRAPRLPRGVACARRAGRGARWWSQTPVVGGARASKRANRYLPSRVIKGHQGSSRAIMGHQWQSRVISNYPGSSVGVTFAVHRSSFAAEIVQHVEGKLDLGVRLIPKRDRRLLIRAQAHLMRDES